MLRLFLFFAIATTLRGYASPVGNTSSPQILEKGFFIPSECWVDVRLGYEGDFVYDGRMNQYKEGSGRVDNCKQHTNSGTFTINVLERLDLYGLVGGSSATAQWRFSGSDDSIQNADLKTHDQLLWGVGARTVLFQKKKTALGLGGRYSSCHYKPKSLTIDGVHAFVDRGRVVWQEWQVNVDVSCQIQLFTPYIGVKYGQARAKLNQFSTVIASDGAHTNHFKNRVPVGLYLGCTISSGKYFMLNVEGRLIDEEAITVSGDLRF